MTINIVEMTLEDLDTVVAMDAELYKKPWKKEDFEYELKDNPFALYMKMIDKETQEIMGYIGVWIKFEEAEITKVSIAKKYQGHHLSKLLMYDIEQRVRMTECENINLEVRVSNQVAINLYTKMGYKTVTTRKKYYENGEDAYLMLKELVHYDNTSD